MSMVDDGDDDLFAELERQFDDQDLSDTVDYSTLSDHELLNEFSDVRSELLNIREMMNPVTEYGRNLHSKRTALLVQIRARGLG